MHNQYLRDSEWAKINSTEDIEIILRNIINGIEYVNKLCSDGKAHIEDTQPILDDFERFDLGIRKLRLLKIINDVDEKKYLKIREDYNEKLKWLNTRIMCSRD